MPAFTRAHYEFIAEVLRRNAQLANIGQLTNALANAFAGNSSKFDADKFIKAAGIKQRSSSTEVLSVDTIEVFYIVQNGRVTQGIITDPDLTKNPVTYARSYFKEELRRGAILCKEVPSGEE